MNFTNMTSFTDLLTQGNNVTDGYLGVAAFVTLFCVLALMSLPYGRNKAIVFASFAAGVLGMFMNMAALLPYWLLAADAIVFGISFFLLVQNRQG